jgi:transposase
VTRLSILDDGVVEVAEANLKQLGSNGVVANKLKAIIAAKKHGIKLTSEVYDINRKTLTSWVKEVKNNRIDNLNIKPGRGRKLKLNKKQEEKILAWVTKDPNITIDKLLSMILNKLGVVLSRATVHRVLQRLSLSYITPRPLHYKQDASTHDEFKKKDC